MAEGGFRVKHWIVSKNVGRETDVWVLDTDMEKVLELQWNLKSDCFTFRVRVNFSPKVKKVRSSPDMSREGCVTKFPTRLT